MTEETTSQKPLPVVDYLKLPDEGDPFLEGCKCKVCGAVFAGTRIACAKCGARDEMETIRLSNRGKLYAYSIVHRSFPGVEVPYVSAVVDLENGGTIKGCLINIEPKPEQLEFDMPVELVYQDALGRKDTDGNSYISYFFQPAQ